MPIVQVSGCPYFTLTVVRALSPFILHHFSVGLVSRYQFILVSLLFVFREFTFSLILTTIRPWLDSPDLRKWKFSLHKETSLTSFVTSKQSFKCSTEHLILEPLSKSAFPVTWNTEYATMHSFFEIPHPDLPYFLPLFLQSHDYWFNCAWKKYAQCTIKWQNCKKRKKLHKFHIWVQLVVNTFLSTPRQFIC